MTQITATLIDSMGSDLSVVNAARVSFGKESEWEEPFEDCDRSLLRLSNRDTKLIKYLAKHKHLSPFGHAFASFHIKAPIFVARQLVKHKFLRWNEISRRYVDDKPEFYVPDVWRGKAESVKQGSSSEGVDLTTISASLGDATDTLATTLEWHKEDCLRIYKDLIESGVAPEMARMVLPQSTMTEFYWSGSLDAFAAMCRLRCASDTQYESRLVADPISDIMAGLFPVSWAALTNGETE
jgi:thymidylate synthase (FAD)